MTRCGTGLGIFLILSSMISILNAHRNSLECSRNEPFKNSTDKQILDCLLMDPKYDKRVRPSLHEKTRVNVSVLLLTLSSPDESSLKYEVEFLLTQQWVDGRLKYQDEGRYSNLKGRSHMDHIWLPDTYFIKHGEFREHQMPKNMALIIKPDGTVSYTMRRQIVLTCKAGLSTFPFDNPICSFLIESISLDDSELLYDWENQSVGVKEVHEIKTLNAYLVGKEAKICTDSYTWGISKFSCLEVWLKFTRDKVFYLSTVFVPSIVLVTSSFITFWLDINAVPARVMIGVTTMLNFCTTMNGFRSSLPVVSNLTAMNVWENVCMFFIYMSLIEFVIVNHLHRTRSKPIIQPYSKNDRERPMELQRQATANSTPSVNETVGVGVAAATSGNLVTYNRGLMQCWSSHSSYEISYMVDKTARYVFPITFVLFVGAFLLAFWIMQQS